jgi:hypothetical protein
MGETNSDHGQDRSDLPEILNSALLMSKMVQTVDQHHIDFPPVKHIELCHFRPVLHHFYFHHLHSMFLAVLVLANLHCVKEVLWLMVNFSIVPYVYTLQ